MAKKHHLPPPKRMPSSPENFENLGILANLIYVNRSGNSAKIELHLIRASDGMVYYQLWSAAGQHICTDVF